MRFFLLFFMIGMLLSGCNNNAADTFSLEEKGDIAFSRRDYPNAVKIWNQIYLKNKKNISVISKIGECYLKLGRPGRAEIFFKKAAEIEPGNIDIQIKLAQLYLLTWNLSEADKICEMFRQKNISHPELDLIKADISLMTNEFDKAENFYRKAVIGSKDSLRALMKLAIFLKSINKNEESLEIFQIVKKKGIVSTPIYLLMADYHLLSDQYDIAEQAILDAIRTEPEDNSLKYHLVQFYIATQNSKKAEICLENMVKNQDDIYFRMILSDVYITNGKLKEAETIISGLKKEITEPTADFELLQGKFWLYSGRSVFTTSHLRSALDLKPGLVNTRYFLGLTHLINGNHKLSENSLSETLQIQPNHYKALLLMSELLYKKEEYDLSLGYIDRLLENYPEDFTGHVIKGLNLMEKKKYRLAEIEFTKSIDLSRSKTYVSLYYLGLIQELLNNHINALNYYKQVLSIKPELLDVSYRYCMLLLKTKQIATADAFIKQKLAATTDSPEVYYLAAKVALITEKRSEGEGFFKKAIGLEETPGFIYMELAAHYKNTGQFEKAVETLKDCTKKNPDFQDAWFALSMLYVDRREMDLALEIMQQGYQNFQDSPVFQSNLAWLLLENNQETDKALNLAQSAFEKMPDSIALADTLGWAYYHKGIYSQAIWLLSEIEKKAPENGFIKYHMGMAFFQQGDIEKATKSLKNALMSEESKYFSSEIDTVLSKLFVAKAAESKTESAAERDLFSPPKNENNDDNIVAPQWKQ